MEREKAFVTRLVQMDVFGGRVIQRDPRTLVLVDVPAWGDAESHRVRAAFPCCEVAYVASTNSLSGFIIVITRHEHAQVTAWLLALLIGGALLLHGALLVRGHSLFRAAEF